MNPITPTYSPAAPSNPIISDETRACSPATCAFLAAADYTPSELSTPLLTRSISPILLESEIQENISIFFNSGDFVGALDFLNRNEKIFGPADLYFLRILLNFKLTNNISVDLLKQNFKIKGVTTKEIRDLVLTILKYTFHFKTNIVVDNYINNTTFALLQSGELKKLPFLLCYAFCTLNLSTEYIKSYGKDEAHITYMSGTICEAIMSNFNFKNTHPLFFPYLYLYNFLTKEPNQHAFSRPIDPEVIPNDDKELLEILYNFTSYSKYQNPDSNILTHLTQREHYQEFLLRVNQCSILSSLPIIPLKALKKAILETFETRDNNFLRVSKFYINAIDRALVQYPNHSALIFLKLNFKKQMGEKLSLSDLNSCLNKVAKTITLCSELTYLLSQNKGDFKKYLKLIPLFSHNEIEHLANQHPNDCYRLAILFNLTGDKNEERFNNLFICALEKKPENLILLKMRGRNKDLYTEDFIKGSTPTQGFLSQAYLSQALFFLIEKRDYQKIDILLAKALIFLPCILDTVPECLTTGTRTIFREKYNFIKATLNLRLNNISEVKRYAQGCGEKTKQTYLLECALYEKDMDQLKELGLADYKALIYVHYVASDYSETAKGLKLLLQDTAPISSYLSPIIFAVAIRKEGEIFRDELLERIESFATDMNEDINYLFFILREQFSKKPSQSLKLLQTLIKNDPENSIFLETLNSWNTALKSISDTAQTPQSQAVKENEEIKHKAELERLAKQKEQNQLELDEKRRLNALRAEAAHAKQLAKHQEFNKIQEAKRSKEPTKTGKPVQASSARKVSNLGAKALSMPQPAHAPQAAAAPKHITTADQISCVVYNPKASAPVILPTSFAITLNEGETHLVAEAVNLYKELKKYVSAKSSPIQKSNQMFYLAFKLCRTLLHIEATKDELQDWRNFFRHAPHLITVEMVSLFLESLEKVKFDYILSELSHSKKVTFKLETPPVHTNPKASELTNFISTQVEALHAWEAKIGQVISIDLYKSSYYYQDGVLGAFIRVFSAFRDLKSLGVAFREPLVDRFIDHANTLAHLSTGDRLAEAEKKGHDFYIQRELFRKLVVRLESQTSAALPAAAAASPKPKNQKRRQ